jgi:hypothetical protein
MHGSPVSIMSPGLSYCRACSIIEICITGEDGQERAGVKVTITIH